MDAGADAERKRLRWRCRRGMRELDVLLERYLRDAWPTASPERRAAFRSLLELADPDLADLCLGRAHATDPARHALIGEITYLRELSGGRPV